MRKQNLLRRGAIESGLRRCGAVAPFWLDAQDVPFRSLGGTSAATTWRERFLRARAAGIEPHPGGRALDGWYAARLLNIHRGLDDGGGGQKAPGIKKVPPTPEELVEPNPSLGLAEGSWPRIVPSTDQTNAQNADAAGTFQTALIAETGDYLDMAGDVAAMGLGRVRRVKQSDAWYACLLPYDEATGDLFLYGEQVRPPGELYARLLNDPDTGAAFGRFGQVSALLHALAALGVRADLGLFNGGGGHESNFDPAAFDAGADFTLLYPDVGNGTYASLSWSQIFDAMPAWQVGMLIPSGEGWNSFYHADVAATHPVGAATEPDYQQFALNVWPFDGDVDDPGQSSFMKECARRKSLALAAYAQAFGEFLAALEASGSLGRPLVEVVETLEVGNELDAFWDSDPSTGQAPLAAQEVGRLMALLAGPIARAVPGMRFRFELKAWARITGTPQFTTLPGRIAWFERVLGEGLVQEVRRWNVVQAEQLQFQEFGLNDGVMPDGTRPGAFPWSPGVKEWLASCAAAGFQWPPKLVDLSGYATIVEQRAALRRARAGLVGFEAHDLLQEIGVHWYHAKNWSERGVELLSNYADLNHLIRDVADLSGAGGRTGFVLDVNVGEIGVSAYAPELGVTSINSAYLQGASPKYQAAYLVQALATVVAAGGRAGSVFTFKFGTETTTAYSYGATNDGFTLASFGKFTTMGIRNDIETSRGFSQDVDLWPRPAWFGVRRLSWLLAQAVDVSVDWQTRGLTVLRFDFGAGIASGPDGDAFRRTWRYGYLVWADPYAESSDLHSSVDLGSSTYELVFSDPSGTFCEHSVSLVPDVVPQTTPEYDPFARLYHIDDNGYVELSHRTNPNPNWTWAGWDAAATSFSFLSSAFVLTLARSDFTSVIAPVFLLTDAEFLEAL